MTVEIDKMIFLFFLLLTIKVPMSPVLVAGRGWRRAAVQLYLDNPANYVSLFQIQFRDLVLVAGPGSVSGPQ